jgi:phage virion morphogenesis protein
MNSTEIVGYDRLGATLDRMVRALSPAGRKKLLIATARRIAAENRKRIAANITPEGTPFEPRKKRKGKKYPKRMFLRLRRARWLKTKTWPNQARLYFAGNAASVAAVHHYGLRDRIERKIALKIKYPARPLLGLSENDKQIIENTVLDHIAAAF